MLKALRLAGGAAFAIGALGASGNPPLWTTSIDSRTSSQWIAPAPGRVYAVDNHRVVAIDANTGKRLWTSQSDVSGAPAFGAHLVAVPVGHSVEFLNADNGTFVRRVVTSDEALVAATAGGIVVMDTGNGSWTGFGANALQHWKQDFGLNGPDTQILSLGGRTVAALSGGRALVIDGSTGAAVAQADDVDEIIGSDGRYLWFGVSDGGIKGLDLNTNRSFALHANIVREAVRVEHGIAVAVIDGRLKSIDLTKPTPEIQPLSIYGRWIGGPIAGKIFVERSDGVYVQNLKGTARPVKVAAYHGDSRIVSSDREIAYIGLQDGTILAVNAPQSTLVARIATPCTFYEGFTATGNTAVVHCDADRESKLLAFRRLTGRSSASIRSAGRIVGFL